MESLSPLWKKIIASVATLVVSYLVLWLLGEFLSVVILRVVAALALALVVWFRVAVWEIDRVVKTAQDAAQNLVNKKV